MHPSLLLSRCLSLSHSGFPNTQVLSSISLSHFTYLPTQQTDLIHTILLRLRLPSGCSQALAALSMVSRRAQRVGVLRGGSVLECCEAGAC
eukprot:4321542-Pleurochrysis_carterae.AAC.1